MLHRVTCANAALPGVCILDILSDRRFPRHSHDQYGVGLMLDGGHVSWSGRGQVEAGPNHVITVSPNEIHDGVPVGGVPRRWRMMFVDPHVIAKVAGTEMATREFPLPAIANPDLARRIAVALHDLPSSSANDSAEIVVDLFDALLDPPEEGRADAKSSRGVQLMLQRIHDDPAETPSLAQLASVASLAPYTALRRFRREVGTTPHAYLLQFRVRMVCKSIRNGRSLAEAALVSGFADQSHMTRAFVRQIGVTPGRWRP